MIRHVLVCVMLLPSLGGCTVPKASDIADVVDVEFISASSNPLKHAIALGDVTGGTKADMPFPLLMSNEKFSEVMTIVLRRNWLLAEKGQERYQLDCILNYNTVKGGVRERSVSAAIHYVVRDKETGKTVFDADYVTKGTARFKGLYVTPLSVPAAAESTQRKADEVATLANLNQFMPAFGAWIRTVDIKGFAAP